MSACSTHGGVRGITSPCLLSPHLKAGMHGSQLLVLKELYVLHGFWLITIAISENHALSVKMLGVHNIHP